MTKMEKVARQELRDMYFDYKYYQHLKKDTDMAKKLLHDYLTCMEFYCNIFGYDLTEKSESLEQNWDSYWRKNQ